MPYFTVYNDQNEILKAIIDIYIPKERFDLDPTYSKGVFYKEINHPVYKYDIKPIQDDVLQADLRNLPFEDNSLDSEIFDLPFVHSSKNGIMSKRFSCCKSQEEVVQLNKEGAIEAYRILKPKGILVIKCQDTVESGKQRFNHVDIINNTIEIGFSPADLFILLSKNKLIDPRWLKNKQKHAYKTHCYFLVFQK